MIEPPKCDQMSGRCFQGTFRVSEFHLEDEHSALRQRELFWNIANPGVHPMTASLVIGLTKQMVGVMWETCIAYERWFIVRMGEWSSLG